MNNLKPFSDVITASIEFQAWVRECNLYNNPIAENATKTGLITPEHFRAFLIFASKQTTLNHLLKEQEAKNKPCITID